MTIRVGIMGFGRIGRNIFRILHPRHDIQVVAISDIVEPEALEYLLRFDTVHGRFPDPVTAKENFLYVKGQQIHIINGKEPGDVPWEELQADIVVEASTQYRTRSWLEKHIKNGAKRVILTTPPDDDLDALIIRGVNDNALKPNHRLVSAGSITVNCSALILKILHNAFDVKTAFFTTVHAYTNAQRLADVPHHDLRQSRAAAENIIPAETVAFRTMEKVFPGLQGCIDGMAMNVPVPDGSNVDLVVETKKKMTKEGVNEVVRSAAGTQYKGLVSFMQEPIVSSDVIGDTHSAVFDSLATQVLGDYMTKTISWFDNGWGYANRVVELIERLAKFEEKA